MATTTVTWGACGAEAIDTSLYYGKSSIVTGNPPGGTGWVLFGGSTLPNTANSATVPIDDNVDYTFKVKCNCTNGLGGTVTKTSIIKNVCPSSFNLSSTVPTIISYSAILPGSVSNAGTWIQKVVFDLLDSSGTTILTSNDVVASPGTKTGSFTGLTGNTQYQVRIKYSNSSGTRTHVCGVNTITTATPCTAPTITLSNGTSTSIDIAITPLVSGDTYDVIVNGVTKATAQTTSTYYLTGLTTNTNYTVQIVKHCAGGLDASSSASFKTLVPGVTNITIINNTSTYYIDSVKVNGVSISGYFAPTAPSVTKYGNTLQTGTLTVQTDDANGHIIVLDTYGNHNCQSSPGAYTPMNFTGLIYGGPDPIIITYYGGDNCP